MDYFQDNCGFFEADNFTCYKIFDKWKFPALLTDNLLILSKSLVLLTSLFLRAEFLQCRTSFSLCPFGGGKKPWSVSKDHTQHKQRTIFLFFFTLWSHHSAQTPNWKHSNSFFAFTAGPRKAWTSAVIGTTPAVFLAIIWLSVYLLIRWVDRITKAP